MKISKFLAFCIIHCLYPFSFVFPRNRKKWAFGSFRGAFNDNAKYLFIQCCEEAPELNCAWLSMNKDTIRFIRSRNLQAYHTLSPRGIWFALTAKYWFFNAYTSDIMYCFSGNAVCVNLWHGLTMKRIEFGIKSGPLAERFVKQTFKERFYNPETFRQPDYMLSSAPFQSDIFARSFRIPIEKCLEFGYPRNFPLTSNSETLRKFIATYETQETEALIEKIAQYKRTFIYMPTWRDSQKNIFSQSMNLHDLDSLLQSKNELMLMKPHANTIIDESQCQQFSNIVFISNTVDVYPILPFIDVLVTDYSSILYDVILMDNKGVILYVYDFNEYETERSFEIPFDENTVGKKVTNFEELLRAITEEDYHVDEQKRQASITKFWGQKNSNPTKKILETFCDSRQ